jgi:uncharacterized protein (UPF0147 family)
MDQQAISALLGIDDGPFRDVTMRSRQVIAEVSHGLHDAAANLLAKALRAVAAGDQARASDLVQRAVQLPFDEHEEVYPGPWAATLLLYQAVTDAVEACAEDDPFWLDAADQALGTADEDGRRALLHTLRDVVTDYQVPRNEARRINDMLHHAGLLDQEHPDRLELAATVPAVLAVVRTVAAYLDALKS